MVKNYPDLFTKEQIQWFKNDLIKSINVNYVDRPFDPDEAQKIFGVDCTIHDRRYILTEGNLAYDKLLETIHQIIPSNVNLYAAYQRQFLPHLLHVDEVNDNTCMDWAYSAIIPLDENINGIFKTLVWNKVCPRYCQLAEFFQEFIKDNGQFPKLNNTSKLYDLDHVWRGASHICDHMPFDGEYVYEIGSMGMFDRTHVHCSSNWKKYNLWEYKDIILLHIG